MAITPAGSSGPTRLYVATWREFRDQLFDYACESTERREQLAFRGHASAGWELKTTLDRSLTFENDVARDRYVGGLLAEFRRQGIRLGLGASNLPTGEAFELLARHHGLPSPLLDWSGSPYIAAFFAFDATLMPGTDRIGIWCLDRTKFTPDRRTADIIDDHELLQFNRRAQQQRSIFLRVATVQQPLEGLLNKALTVFELPASERDVALADLDEMSINSANLFYDLDGAARTARSRVRR